MGPKDTPFEGGVFAAKLTFVSIARSLVPIPRPLLIHKLTHTHTQSLSAARLSALPVQDEVRAPALPPKQ